MFGIIAVWVVCAFIGAALLESSGRAGLGFVLGLLLGPIGLIIAAIMRLEKPQTSTESVDHADERKCPDCAEWVKAEARRCRFCGAALSPVEPRPVATRAPRAAAVPTSFAVNSRKSVIGMAVFGVAIIGVIGVIIAVTVAAGQ